MFKKEKIFSFSGALLLITTIKCFNYKNCVY